MEENEALTPAVEAAEVAETAEPAEEIREEIKETTEPRRERDKDRPSKRGFNKKPNFKKVCLFCQEKSTIDYKEVNKLKKFISEGGKILPRRMTGTCAKHQREVAVAIKRARVAALIPFKAD